MYVKNLLFRVIAGERESWKMAVKIYPLQTINHVQKEKKGRKKFVSILSLPFMFFCFVLWRVHVTESEHCPIIFLFAPIYHWIFNFKADVFILPCSYLEEFLFTFRMVLSDNIRS